MSVLVDLSHQIEDGMTTYPGLPAPRITDHLGREASAERYAAGVTFQIGRIDMVANTGTYLDTPFHRLADGADLAGLLLMSVADLPAVVVRAGGRAIGPESFEQRPLSGRAVLFHTGWDVRFRTDRYLEGAPYLTEAAARRLADAGVALAGIDSVNIDDVADQRRPVHSVLLAAGIPIVEHLTNLGSLPDEGARFFAVPPKVKGLGSFPVRAFAIV